LALAISICAEVPAFAGVVIRAHEKDLSAAIPDWKEDSPAMHSIMQYVEAVTDEASPDYVPEEERIAVFDLDGTLTGERYPEASMRLMVKDRLLELGDEADPEALELAKAMEEAIRENAPLPKFTLSATKEVAKLFSGFTLDEYKAYLQDFMKRPVGGFEGMTFGTRFYKPMVSLVEYLCENGFQVYIISGSERMFVREQIKGTLDEWIPASRVIGSTLNLTATGEGDTAGSEYTYAADDQVLIGDSVASKAVKMNKVSSIVNEIGTAPVLAFGNSSGDYAMGQYCVQNGGKAYILLCDDTQRDYGDETEAAKCAEDCASYGFETVSMRDEFETIYGEEMEPAEEAVTQQAEEAATEPAEELSTELDLAA
jgi:phosphoglycolate phosphatase-like HAD superfamily hydrolase